MYKIILQYVNWEVSDQSMQDCSKIVTPESFLPIKRDACSWQEIFSTCECGLFWALVLHSDDPLSVRA